MTSVLDSSAIPEVEEEPSPAPRSFCLLGWFSAVSLVAIAGVGAALVWFLTSYLTAHVLLRDAEVSRDFIESVLSPQNMRSLGQSESGAAASVANPFVERIARLPDIVRANLYARDRTAVWSTDQDLIGRRFEENAELEKAFAGEIMVESGDEAADETKSEHVHLRKPEARLDSVPLVEMYLPIRDNTASQIIAVAEIYKTPHALFDAVRRDVRLVWIGVAAGGAFLYVAFFWIIYRADAVIRDQREQLIEAETLTAIGEMAAAVAHGIRNPLASIRSAAEIAREEDGAGANECINDILEQSDRLDGWVRELLATSRNLRLARERVDVNRLVRDVLDGRAADLRRRDIALVIRQVALPPIRGSQSPLAHALGSVVSNAIEAMPKGGQLLVENRLADPRHVEIVIEDTGIGMSLCVVRRALRPMFTTKRHGIGRGLSLARRIIERHAGKIEVQSAHGRGTRVVLSFPTEA